MIAAAIAAIAAVSAIAVHRILRKIRRIHRLLPSAIILLRIRRILRALWIHRLIGHHLPAANRLIAPGVHACRVLPPRELLQLVRRIERLHAVVPALLRLHGCPLHAAKAAHLPALRILAPLPRLIHPLRAHRLSRAHRLHGRIGALLRRGRLRIPARRICRLHGRVFRADKGDAVVQRLLPGILRRVQLRAAAARLLVVVEFGHGFSTPF